MDLEDVGTPTLTNTKPVLTQKPGIISNTMGALHRPQSAAQDKQVSADTFVNNIPSADSSIGHTGVATTGNVADQKEQGIVLDCLSTMLQDLDAEQNLFAFKAKRDPDTMYYHEAMKAHDRPRFVEAVNKEIDSLQSTNTFTIVPRTSILEGTRILPMVWNMRRKRNQTTG